MQQRHLTLKSTTHKMKTTYTGDSTEPHRIFCTYGQLAFLVGAIIVAGFLRLQTLDGSLRHDEAYTLQAFASQPYEHIATSYPAPNNHILHSLLVRSSVQLLGTET